MKNISIRGRDASAFMQRMLHPDEETLRMREAFLEECKAERIIDFDRLQEALKNRNK